MLLHALDAWYPGEAALIAAQADWGLDPLVVLPSWSPTRPGDPRDLRGYQFDYPGKVNATLRGLPVHCHPDVRLREWREVIPGARYPVLQREYLTPAGPLQFSAHQTEDWPYGDRLLFVDDFIIARARKPLVTTAADLKALAYLVQPLGCGGSRSLPRTSYASITGACWRIWRPGSAACRRSSS